MKRRFCINVGKGSSFFEFEFSEEMFSKWNRYWAVWPRGFVYFVPFLHRVVRASRSEPEFKAFVEHFKELTADFDDNDRIKAVIYVCRQTRYVTDKKMYNMLDYWATAPETLYNGKGDCDDIAILINSVLLELGYDCVFVWLRNHLACAVAGDFDGVHFVKKGKKYYWVDSTSFDDIGVISKTYEKMIKIPVRAH